MSEWKAKRFWTAATVAETDGGWHVLLDGRAVKTPAKSPLVSPSRALADEIATEWDAQENEIDPRTMPYTCSLNSAIDRVAPQRREVGDIIAAYGETDLLCYRADRPAELAARQAEHWDPVLAWLAQELSAALTSFDGVIFGAQPQNALDALSAEVHAKDAFQMTALHDLVALSGSLVLGLAVTREHLDALSAWNLSRIDEEWQADQWGRDDEADALSATKRAAFEHAARLYRMVS